MELFNNVKPIVGMVHLLPLPATPGFKGDLQAIYNLAQQDAQALLEGGVDGLIIENFGDEPFLNGEITLSQMAVMARVASEIRTLTDKPLGINAQFNAYESEVALAYACDAQFIRVEVFVDTVVAAQGIVHPCAPKVMRYQQALGALEIQIWADIQTKYTTNLVAQSIAQSAIDAQAAGADTLIVTGAATGQETPLDAVAEVKRVVDLPVLVGSGTNIDNVTDVLQMADGAIVGSSLKVDGQVLKPVSRERTQDFMAMARSK